MKTTGAIRTLFSGIVAVLALASFASEPDNLNPIGTMGKGEHALKGNKEAVLFEYQGRGCLTHFWFGGDFKGVEDTHIRYYIDGEEMPSIDMDLYMGHGIGFSDNQGPWATKHMGKIGRQNGVFNNYRIPFGKSIRVTAQRADNADDDQPIWWIIRGIENGRVAIGNVELPKKARLRLVKRENYGAAPLEEFDLCNVKGKGALYQVTMEAQGSSFSYLEACMRAYLGGKEKPLMLSSGLEDYFLGTYYFNSGKYYSDISGLTHFDTNACCFSAYRFHDDDPIFFQNGLRLTCRCGEAVHGETTDAAAVIDVQQTWYTTYTWIYQW